MKLLPYNNYDNTEEIKQGILSAPKVAIKLGKTHQNVLVFVKGDGKKATQACGPIDVHVPEGDGDE